MNYFELHIGDYEAATAHLSLLEDAAYGRLLRIYYRTERPLPADTKQVCRLVRAASKPERDAVQAVLDEFFELREDGWHQVRCDEELQRYADREPEREAKKANEDTRLKRHREERAALFKALNDAGQHAPWNTKIEALRAMVAPLQKQTATAPATQPETPVPPLPATAPATPATATHGNVPPPPTSQSPKIEEKEERVPAPARKRASPPPARPPDVSERVWLDWLDLRNAKRAPVTATVLDSAREEAAKAGLHLEAFLRLWCGRGSQGLQADWLKPHERGGATPPQPAPEPAWRTEQRARNVAFLGPAASPEARAAVAAATPETFDMEAPDAAPQRLG